MPRLILLVDDSPSVRSILRVYLMGAGASFEEAGDGERGLQLARLLPIDLVIADVRMPRMDGVAFTAAVRADEHERVRQLPVILLTGETDPLLRTRSLAAGASDFLHKPVSAKALLAAVERLLPQPAMPSCAAGGCK
ncbi:MAG: response regulator [Myxococcaceae bacterium]